MNGLKDNQTSQHPNIVDHEQHQPMTIVLVPIKHASERLPGKNFRMVAGKPLYMWILETLIGIKTIDRIIIDTDSPIILDAAKNGEGIFGREPHRLRALFRPQRLNALNDVAGHRTSMNTLIKRILCDLTPEELENIGLTQNQIDEAFFIQTHTTNPCLKVKTLEEALTRFRANTTSDPSQYSLLSVTSHQSRFYMKSESGNKMEMVPINHDPSSLVRTQELNPIYEDNSCFYIFHKVGFMPTGNRVATHPEFFEIEDIRESIDIDYEIDLQMAELCLEARKKLANNELRRTVLITGAVGGLGTAMVRNFNKNGWKVYETDLKDCEPYNCDLSRTEEIQSLVKTLSTNLSPESLDAVVLGAAYQQCYSLYSTPKEIWDHTLSVNLSANYLLIQALLKAGLLGSGSRITIIGSVHSVCTSPGIAAYSVSKAALTNLTRCMALELGPEGIAVNCLHPGAILTPMLKAGLQRKGDDLPKALERMEKSHPLGKIAMPEDISKAVYFLSTEEGIAFNGSNLIADGGVHARLASE